MRYRFIRYGDGFEELYDRDTDPHEFTNRAADPALAVVKTRLALGLPSNAAPDRMMPANSPYNLRPAGAGKKKTTK